MLDKHINVDERISRSYAYRCRGLEQRIKFAESTNDQAEIKSAQKRQKEVIQKAIHRGLTNINNKGRTVLVNEMSTFVDLVSSQLKEEETYRLLSSMTHGHQWALIPLGYIPIAEIPDGNLLKKTISIESIGYLTFTGINAYQKMTNNKCKLYGWPLEEIQKAFGKINRAIAEIFKSSISNK